MSYILNGTTIRNPSTFDEQNSTLVAEQRTLSGSVNRDYFGSNKKVWQLNYKNCNSTDFSTINTIYQTYLSTGTAVSWQVTETNYTVSSTNVHVDIQQKSFSIPGTDYLTDFTLVLTEA